MSPAHTHSVRPLRLLAYGLLILAIVLPFLTLLGLAFPGAVQHSTASSGLWGHYAATVLPSYLGNTALLAVMALALAVLFGVGCAWQIERYRFPGRDTLSWALLLPLAMPAYVAAYAMADFTQFSGPLQTALRAHFGWGRDDYWFPEVASLPGAAICFGLTLYPYVYLLARTAFAERGHELQDAARTLGLSRSASWWRAVLPAARPAIAGGALLVLMEILADYGAVSYLGVDTLSVGIFRAWYNMSDLAAAAQLALSLLAVVILVVWGERHLRSRARYGSSRTRRPRAVELTGASAWSRLLLCSLPLSFGFVLPVLLLLRLLLQAGSDWLSPQAWAWIANSVRVGLTVAAITVGLALLLQMRLRLWHEPWAAWISRLLGLGYAIPGAVLALGVLIPLAYLDNRLVDTLKALGLHPSGLILTGSTLALVYAISIRFFGVAANSTQAAFARVAHSLDDGARVLGMGPGEIFRRVHWPLVRRSAYAAALLVFIDTLKELPATIALRPFNFETLATVTYNYARDERLSEAALPSLLIVLASLPAVLLLTRQRQAH